MVYAHAKSFCINNDNTNIVISICSDVYRSPCIACRADIAVIAAVSVRSTLGPN
jgi:hypothetical protein